MAQLVEQHIRNVQVAGSSPAGSSISRQRTWDLQVRCLFICCTLMLSDNYVCIYTDRSRTYIFSNQVLRFRPDKICVIKKQPGGRMFACLAIFIDKYR